jgi:hypothetical protein
MELVPRVLRFGPKRLFSEFGLSSLSGAPGIKNRATKAALLFFLAASMSLKLGLNKEIKAAQEPYSLVDHLKTEARTTGEAEFERKLGKALRRGSSGLEIVGALGKSLLETGLPLKVF